MRVGLVHLFHFPAGHAQGPMRLEMGGFITSSFLQEICDGRMTSLSVLLAAASHAH